MRVRLSLEDSLIATIGERPMSLHAITEALAKQGHKNKLLQDVRHSIEDIRRRHIVADTRDGFVSARRFA